MASVFATTIPVKLNMFVCVCLLIFGLWFTQTTLYIVAWMKVND